MSYAPPYCYYEGGSLKFNTGGTNTGSCSSYDTCICLGDAPSEAALDILVQVRRQNMEALKEVALAVSTPGNPKYGYYLSTADVNALTAPADADVAAVELRQEQNQVPGG